MMFSVDAPMILNQEDAIMNTSPQVEEHEISEEPVPLEPLRLNVLENPSFEEWDSVLNKPEGWYAQASAYQFADAAYTDVVATGSYAGLVEAKGSDVGSGSGYLLSYPMDETTLIEPGISLSFNWNVLANPDLNIGAESFLFIQTDDGVGTAYNFYYYLSTGATGYVNASNNAKIMMNDTINQWNTFDRNITEDFLDVFGAGPLTSESYITRIWFYANSPATAMDKIQAVFDDVVLYNSTFSSWIENADFESGTGAGWNWYHTDSGYVTQSTDRTLDTYSLNVSVPIMRHGSGFATSYISLNAANGYHALYPRMNIIELDWKYNDTVGAGQGQYAYFRLSFYNGTYYFVQFFFGYGTDSIPSTNTTTNFYIKMPGFGVRDTWQHSEIDVFDICNELGLINLTITQVSFYAYQAMTDAGVELLVDNLKMMTYPTSDPTFEHVHNWGRFNPFTGWGRFTGSGVVEQSSEAHGGSYSANITVENGEEGIERNLLYAELDPNLFTDFWWRLEDIQDAGSAYAWIDLEFIASGVSRHTIYVLGKSPSFPLSNSTSHKYLLVDGFNQTGIWTRLYRNITADIENVFSTTPEGWFLFYVGVKMSAGAGMRTSLLVDDLHFIDGEPPSLDASIVSTPMYYEDTHIEIAASDTRPGVSEVMINYTTDGWSSWNAIIALFDVDVWFNAYIPAQPYGTDVEFYAIATDGGGLQTIDDNSGFMYTYTVGDDLDPILDSPDDVEFTVGETGNNIDWNPTDDNPASYDVFVDEVSTYTGPWNSSSEHIIIDLDDLAIGTYNFTCVVYDVVGNDIADTVIVTVTATTPGPGDPLGMILILAGVGAVAIIIIVVVMLKKKE